MFPSPNTGAVWRPGVNRARSMLPSTPSARSVSPVNAVTATGVLWSDSSRLCAVTTISSIPAVGVTEVSGAATELTQVVIKVVAALIQWDIMPHLPWPKIGYPPTFTGRQQKFDESGSPYVNLYHVSRQAHAEKFHDGQCGDAKSHEVGVQVPCSFHPQVPPQGAVCGVKTVSWGGVSSIC